MISGWTGVGAARHSGRVFLFLALLGAWLSPTAGWAGTIREVAIGDEKIVLRFDAPVHDASAFLLSGPDRIAVDIAGTAPGTRVEPAGAVSGVRQGRHGTDGARVVFDLVRPVVIDRGKLEDGGRKLVLALSPVSPLRFVAAAASGRMRFPGLALADRPQRSQQVVRMRVPPPAKGPRLPEIRGAAGRPLVVIDAGHGGHDPGAVSDWDGGVQEKDLTLRTARAVRDALLASGKVRVALTRDRDEFLILQERYGIARRLGADLFISIHCDSAENQQASGATAYTLSEIASDKEAARLAARENRADILAGVDLADANADISSILIDLTQRETMNRSAGFARLLGREAKPLIPVKANFHRMASLMVLKAPDMPSILFETGYISNEGDAARLNSADGRQAIARSIRQAVEIHFARQFAAR